VVLSDEIIQVEVDKGSMKTKLKLRKITYYDREHKRTLSLLVNLFEFRADTIAALYKLRWQIEHYSNKKHQNIF
jgi:IS4 transposase